MYASLFFRHSRANGNPVLPLTSGYPLEFTPYLIRGGYDDNHAFADRLYLVLGKTKFRVYNNDSRLKIINFELETGRITA
jgi:hypothetical protein